MSRQIVSGKKVSYKIVNTLESSAGNILRGSTDNQSICTCGKFRSDTHSTYNGTIQTKVKNKKYNTGDKRKDA